MTWLYLGDMHEVATKADIESLKRTIKRQTWATVVHVGGVLLLGYAAIAVLLLA